MLIEFKFGNYLSFRDENSFDMRKARVADYPHHVVECGTDKVLKTSAIYGANASGKTNLYRAFQAMREYVIQSLNFGGNTDLWKIRTNFILLPFLFDKKSPHKDITFEVFFYHTGKSHSYNYGFSVDSEKWIVKEEWLNSKAKTQRTYRQIFYRTSGTNPEYLSDDISAEQQKVIAAALNKETLLISLGAKLKIQICELVYQWFGQVNFLDFGNPLTSVALSGTASRKFLENDSKEVAEMVQFLATFDTAIKGFTSNKIEGNQSPDTKSGYSIYAKHQMNDSPEEMPLPFFLESAGTQKMFSLYEPIRTALRTGGVLVIDEMSDRLHPLLQRNLILTFLDPERNPKNAQLIFTTHDVTLLATNLLRRDEIWIVEKDRKNNTSELYSITDFKNESDACIRKDNCLWKRFLSGEYGGIPCLEDILIPGLEDKHAE